MTLSNTIYFSRHYFDGERKRCISVAFIQDDKKGFVFCHVAIPENFDDSLNHTKIANYRELLNLIESKGVVIHSIHMNQVFESKEDLTEEDFNRFYGKPQFSLEW